MMRIQRSILIEDDISEDNDNERLNQVGLGVLGIGTAATLAATFALAQQ